MRKYFLPLTICIFLSLVSIYLVRNLNPFNPEALQLLIKGQNILVHEELVAELQSLAARGLIWEYLSPRNVALIAAVIGAAAIAGFTLMHLIIDKLFFKQFYQSPSMTTAVRRGALIMLTTTALLAVRLLAGQWYLYLAVIVVAIALEVVAWNFFYREPLALETGEQQVSTIRLLWISARSKVLAVRDSLMEVYRQQQKIVEGDDQELASPSDLSVREVDEYD
jgi:hypothetical protein